MKENVIIENVAKEVEELATVEKKVVKEEKLLDSWKPRTELGRRVKNNEINIDEILDNGLKILEPEIVDFLLSNLTSETIMVGQSKGKFGGGKRSVWKQTQKKTREGNKPKFATLIAVGNKNGYIGIGYGKSKETVPARLKAVQRAKINLIKIRRGCGSWACGCGEPHSIPLKVEGKCGSVKIQLIPAPKGTSLCVEKEVRRLLDLAGVKDVYSKTFGQTRTKINLINACFEALKNLAKMKTDEVYSEGTGVKGVANE